MRRMESVAKWFLVGLCFIGCEAFSQSKKLYPSNEIVPFRYIQPDQVCKGWKASEEVKTLLLSLKEQIEEDPLFLAAFNQLPLSVKRGAVIEYLKQLGSSTALEPRLRALAHVQANALCAISKNKIPATALSQSTLAEVLQLDVYANPYYDYKNTGDNHFILRRTIFQEAGFTMAGYMHYIWPDHFAVDRVYKLINALKTITGDSKVLNLAAGRGVLADGLQKKGIEISVTDNYELTIQTGYGNEIDMKSYSRKTKKYMRRKGIIKVDMFKAVDIYSDHRIYLTENPPGSILNLPEIVFHQLIGQEERFIIMLADNKHFDDINKQVIRLQERKKGTIFLESMDLKVSSAHSYLSAYVIYLDNRAETSPEVHKNIQYLKEIHLSMDKLLEKQNQGSQRQEIPDAYRNEINDFLPHEEL